MARENLGQRIQFRGHDGNLVLVAGSQDTAFDFLLKCRAVDHKHLRAEVGQFGRQFASLVGDDEDGDAMIDALALDALFQREAFQFVRPVVPGIGVNMCCHACRLPPFQFTRMPAWMTTRMLSIERKNHVGSLYLQRNR
ncbi:hypothetical protein SDC9_133914 [bioreactor metagenome]|uniref:Uncharacterized protein n=1 Tax=bioreactor metagenome TaxID=1076179 RepID=A0A645DE18_9ZZZZ